LGFRKGAFASLKKVIPVSMKYVVDTYSPAYDIVPIFPLGIMQMSLFKKFEVNAQFMPAFTPNEYLFKKHADKGTEKWEIFAWAVRDVIAKSSNLIKTDVHLN
jgi:hypothetical protein